MLRDAANKQGMTVAEFVRETLILRSQGDDVWLRSMLADTMSQVLAK